MATDPRRCVLADVPKLGFGPQSDIFCSALRIALEHMGDAEAKYHNLLGWSGRGYRICWSDRMFFWDRHMDKADPDPEQYLRTDYETAAAAAAAAGYEGQILLNAACCRPEAASCGEQGDAGAMRELVTDSIREGRPVVVAMSLSAEHWAPEWSLITGYDEGGATVVGWSCHQGEDPWKAEIDFEPDGAFRLGNWEANAVAAVRLCGSRQDVDRAALEKRALELGTTLARGREDGLDTWGVSSYEAWARALEAEDLADLEDPVLKGRMQYHIHYVGHLAAQRWYTSVFLKEMEATPWSASDVLRAAACYADIHEFMWECWKVAGGYWRDEDDELPRFREPAARAEIAGIVRAAGRQDGRALEHMEVALEAWDKTHGYYIHS